MGWGVLLVSCRLRLFYIYFSCLFHIHLMPCHACCYPSVSIYLPYIRIRTSPSKPSQGLKSLNFYFIILIILFRTFVAFLNHVPLSRPLCHVSMPKSPSISVSSTDCFSLHGPRHIPLSMSKTMTTAFSAFPCIHLENRVGAS